MERRPGADRADGTRGLTPAMLKSGKPVTLEAQVRTDGTAEMKIQRLTIDGKAYELLR